MSPHLTPFEICLRIIGAPEQIAKVCHTADKSPYGWRGASANRDAGDIPSARHMRALLAYAAAHDLPLVAEDLIFGISEDLLAQRLRSERFPPAGNCSASVPSDHHEQPGTQGGGAEDPAASFPFRSRAGRRGPGASMQAAAPARPGEDVKPLSSAASLLRAGGAGHV